jgi:hypothetical protein
MRSPPHFPSMAGINKTADEATARKYGILHRVRLWYFWTFLYVLVVAVGVLIIAYASQSSCDAGDQDMEEGGSVTALKGFEGSPSIMTFR